MMPGIGLYSRETQTYKYIKKFWADEPDIEAKENRMRANDGERQSIHAYKL
jgi:hypothetical protein